uniref:Flavin-containing monooxygenase n=1 Tax=Falco tinnunculus TaxID=100819 RepID=A0A8C4XL56_FALTI
MVLTGCDGIWRRWASGQVRDQAEEGRASIYCMVFTSSCKATMRYSDFPIPNNHPWGKHPQLPAPLNPTDSLHLLICSVKKHPDFSVTERWELVTQGGGKEELAGSDAVMVCSGHHVYPNLPLTTFPGKLYVYCCFHSWEFKRLEKYRGKKVLVIGLGNSGCDIAMELSTQHRCVTGIEPLGKGGSPICSSTCHHLHTTALGAHSHRRSSAPLPGCPLRST